MFNNSIALALTGLSPTDTSVVVSTTIAGNNATVSSNITSTSGTVSSGNPTGIPLPNETIPVSASSSVDGVQAFGNGTIVTSINGVQTSFYFDPSAPSSGASLTVQSSDLSGNQFSGMYTSLYSGGKAIKNGYTPITFSITPGVQYSVCVANWQGITFNHWDDGSVNYCRTFTISQSTTFTAYYSTGGTTPTVPGSPAGLAATAVSSSQINLSWTAPSNNGGSAITGYRIDRSSDNGSTWSTIASNTGNTNTSYSDFGLLPDTTYTYRVSAINSVGIGSPSNTASATTFLAPSGSGSYSITKAQSGLVAFDPLNNQTRTQQELQANQKYWSYDGSAVAEGAPYNFFEDLQGLHIGVQAKTAGKWAGFFAVTPNTNAAVFHAIVSTPLRTLSDNNYENGLYVQTANGKINYVTCVSLTNNQDTAWAIVNTYGNTNQATKFNILWMDNSPNQPLTRDCTIITNGNNYLKVYLDGTMVYSSNTLKLQMPAPFNAYLEPETSYAGQILYGTFTDYYATASENIKVTNNPTNAAMAEVVDSTGKILASASVNSGTATINVGMYDFPLNANIQVYDSNKNLLASTSSPINIFGGDTYTIS